MPLRGIAMNTQEPDPPLPRKPEDVSELQRLRKEALQHLDAEERPSSATVYGGPAPVYGGPPSGGPVTRRWTLKRILILVFSLVAAALAALFALWKRPPAPPIVIYGGPPIQRDPRENQPLYVTPTTPVPGDKHPHRKPSPVPGPKPTPPQQPPPAAAVYGGPAPRPPQPPTPPEPPQ
jgi:hypothetical protein